MTLVLHHPEWVSLIPAKAATTPRRSYLPPEDRFQPRCADSPSQTGSIRPDRKRIQPTIREDALPDLGTITIAQRRRKPRRIPEVLLDKFELLDYLSLQAFCEMIAIRERSFGPRCQTDLSMMRSILLATNSSSSVSPASGAGRLCGSWSKELRNQPTPLVRNPLSCLA